MTNPFPSQTQQAPAATISDAAAAEFGAQQSQNAFLAAQQAAAQQPSAQMQPQGQVPTQGYAAPQQQYSPGPQADYAAPVQQAYAQQAPAQPQQPVTDTAMRQFAQGQQFAPSLNLPGQPWSPAQHQQNVPQAYTPQAPPAQQPPAAPQGLPQAPFPGSQPQFPGGGFPGAQQAAQGGGYDPSLFGAPAGGGGNYPKVRDLDGRLCLFRVKRRDASGTAYNDPTKTVTNYVANVAVLDGGPLYSSPSQDDPTGVPVLVSETVPYVIGDMTIGQLGLQNRLKADFVRGRVVRMPKGKFEESLRQQFPGMEPWQALWSWLAQDASRMAQLVSGTYFWGIVEDASPQADQLVAQFGQHPSCRELML